MVVPAFREDPDILERCLDTWLAEDPGEVIVVPDLEDLEVIRRLRGRVTEATSHAVTNLAAIGLNVTRPREGGFYLWVELPAGIDELALCRQAAAHSIFLAPGRVFRPDRQGHAPSLRINVAHASHPRFLAFMKKAVPH